MKQTPDDIYQKVKQLGLDVKEQLKRQGIIVPTKTPDGSIRVGYYTIKKNKTGFYSILNYSNESVVEFINLLMLTKNFKIKAISGNVKF
jgi:hypothetical protein